MKTLIFNGSPRKNGDTAAMINFLMERLIGEVKIVNAYDNRIAPCIDCRACRKNEGCVINDDMQDVYEYLKTCDSVVIASPVYYSELTGQLLGVLSRFQTYFSARRFRGEAPLISRKKGAVILAGGGTGEPCRAYKTASEILSYINVYDIFPMICSGNTDATPAVSDMETLIKVREAAEFLTRP